jgi:hypothetical protein
MKWSDSGGKEFAPAPTGNHPARCIGIIDLGTQTGEWQGKPIVRRQCVIQWELPMEPMEDGRPFVVSKFYTASLSDKATLRHDLEAWRGREFTAEELAGFDSKNVLGKPCMVQVIHTDKGKAKVANVSALPKGLKVPDAANDLTFFSLDEFNQASFDGLSDWFKKTISSSPEYKIATGGREERQPASDWKEIESDIPF